MNDTCANPVCEMPPARRKTATGSKRTSRYCSACRCYRQRHGVDRPAWMARALPLTCRVEDCARPVKYPGRCPRHQMVEWRARRRAAGLEADYAPGWRERRAMDQSA